MLTMQLCVLSWPPPLLLCRGPSGSIGASHTFLSSSSFPPPLSSPALYFTLLLFSSLLLCSLTYSSFLSLYAVLLCSPVTLFLSHPYLFSSHTPALRDALSLSSLHSCSQLAGFSLRSSLLSPPRLFLPQHARLPAGLT